MRLPLAIPLSPSTWRAIDTHTLNPLTDPQWDHFVKAHPGATVFHTSAWARVLAQTYGHTPCYLSFACRGQTVALVPLMEVNSWLTGRRGICLPFSDFCSPLYFGNAPACVDEVMVRLTDLGRQRSWKYLELRGSTEEGDACVAESYYEHRLDLSQGETAVKAGFAPSVRRAVRKAQRYGLEAFISQSEESVFHFFHLHERTRRRHGSPPQPASFFKAIHQHLIGPGKGFVSLVRTPASSGQSFGKLIAASIFLRSGQSALYKFGASDERYWHLRPNNLSMSHAIDVLVQSGVKELSFGRTAMDHGGLRQFKRSWGTLEKVTPYIRILREPDAHRKFSFPARFKKLQYGVFGHVPLAWNRAAGSLIYPHLD